MKQLSLSRSHGPLPLCFPVQTENGPRLRLQVYPIDWELAKGPKGELLTPDLPVAPTAKGAGKVIELKPYGQTQLRLTVFPVLYKK